MFNTMMKQIKEIAINEAVSICEKTQFMDKTIFYNQIKDMAVQDISQISIDIVLTYNMIEVNKGFKVSKSKNKMKMVM